MMARLVKTNEAVVAPANVFTFIVLTFAWQQWPW